MKMMTAILFCSMVMSAAAGAAIIPLNNDPIAIDGQTGLVSATWTQGSHTYICDVAYAVYKTTAFSSHYGFDPSNGQDSYIYAYQLFNSVESNTGIKVFEIGIPQDIMIGNIAYSPLFGVTSGIAPHSADELHDSAVWKFSKDPIAPGNHSAVLLFTADFAPATAIATSHAGTIDDLDGFSVAAPSSSAIPEPATLIILGLGSLILRKHRAF